MLKKILQPVGNIFLLLLPFFSLTENIYPVVNNENFPGYLLTCSIIGLLIIALGFFAYNSNSSTIINPPKLSLAAWLLLALGILAMIPLHMGPPREDATLLTSATLEKTRYAMLLLAVIVFFIAVILTLKPLWPTLNIAGKAIIVPLLLTLFISLWDHYDSYMFSSKLAAWTGSGKTADNFFPSYNFHEAWRTAGRILLYVVTVWLSVILAGKSIIKIWVAVLLVIFCLAGTGSCIMFLLTGPQFYFPFMVPAIVLAPAYWLGIVLLNRLSR